jgi:hypothetical protein
MRSSNSTRTGTDGTPDPTEPEPLDIRRRTRWQDVARGIPRRVRLPSIRGVDSDLHLPEGVRLPASGNAVPGLGPRQLVAVRPRLEAHSSMPALVPPGHWMQGGFWIGLHVLRFAVNFPQSCISANVLRRRQSGFPATRWMMDSGAFTEISTYGTYRHSCKRYARQIIQWSLSGSLVAAVSQDYMCEPFILQKTGLTVEDHQRLTVERYDQIRAALPGWVLDHVTFLPVLQGYEPEEYVRHLEDYGDRLAEGMWVGVGSVCKRNADPSSVRAVLSAIRAERPDLHLHGFGIKTTALADRGVLRDLWSADSMAWSRSARYAGKDANGLAEATEFYDRIQASIQR